MYLSQKYNQTNSINNGDFYVQILNVKKNCLKQRAVLNKMSGEKGDNMKKSLFRIADVSELSIAYIFCFTINILIEYIKTLEVDPYVLQVFIQNFIDYQLLIILLFTFIVFIFHYQMLQRKKEEIFCKILVGDTISNIRIWYVLECLIILTFVFLLSIIVNIYFNFNLTNNFYLVLVFIIYIIVSARKVQKHESF